MTSKFLINDILRNKNFFIPLSSEVTLTALDIPGFCKAYRGYPVEIILGKSEHTFKIFSRYLKND